MTIKNEEQRTIVEPNSRLGIEIAEVRGEQKRNTRNPAHFKDGVRGVDDTGADDVQRHDDL